MLLMHLSINLSLVFLDNVAITLPSPCLKTFRERFCHASASTNTQDNQTECMMCWFVVRKRRWPLIHGVFWILIIVIPAAHIIPTKSASLRLVESTGNVETLRYFEYSSLRTEAKWTKKQIQLVLQPPLTICTVDTSVAARSSQFLQTSYPQISLIRR
jgi:hypothetical protein